MPKLILKFENRVLQEIVLGSEDVHIGRLPDNTVAIDNPAVSGRHARVACGSGSYVLMDLKSTNGTFVNEQLITEHTLRNGDVVLVGKHQLVFVDAEDTEAATPLADPGGLSRGRWHRYPPSGVPTVSSETCPSPEGVNVDTVRHDVARLILKQLGPYPLNISV